VDASTKIDSDVQVLDLRTRASSFSSTASTPTAPMQVQLMVDVHQRFVASMNSDDAGLGSSDAATGASASSSVDVDARPKESTAKTMRNQARNSCSNVWQDMDEVKKVADRKEVRVGAICKCYKPRLSASSNGGTGHLHQHIKACKRKVLAISSPQSHLHFSSDGHIQRFQYNPNVARSKLCHLIARLD
jgi:hypothetical protein